MSQKHSLQWSHAFIDRMEKVTPVNKADSLGARLSEELATLPFLTMTYREELEQDMAKVLPHCQKYEHMLVLGIGGSALGARALQKAFMPGQDGPSHQGPWLWIADNVCPATFTSWLDKLPPEKTMIVCISKSGGTIETLSQYFLCCSWLKKHRGQEWTKQMVLITDKHKGFLRQEVQEHGFSSLTVPDNLGGRYSALSAVGMLPAAYMNMDWKGLLDGAASVAAPLVANPHNIGQHPAYSLATWAHALEQNNYSEIIFFSYIPQWATFGPWFAQLWAESLGKEGKGTMPIAAVGATDQHSVNQMFLDGPRNKACLFLGTDSLPQGPKFTEKLPESWQWLQDKYFGELLQAEALGTAMALTQHKVPMVHMQMASIDTAAAGALMLLLEAATVFTGWLMEINPLDQPAVELGKRLANARLGAPNLTKENADLATYLGIQEKIQNF